MAALEDVEGLSEVIGRAIQEHLERSNINIAWPQIDNLVRPILRVEAFLEDAGQGNILSPRSERVASVSTYLPFLARFDWNRGLAATQSPRCAHRPTIANACRELWS